MRQVKRQKIQLDQIDIREVLDDLGIHYTEEGKNVSSDWIGVTCPFPGCDDQTNHLGINLKSPVVTCLKCGTKGNILKYLAEELRSFPKALQILGDAVPRELRQYESTDKQFASKVIIPERFNSQPSKQHIDFLKKRRFNPKFFCEKYDLLFTNDGVIDSEGGKWGNRIIFPIMKGYKMLTWTSVDVTGDHPVKYKHLKDELSVYPIKHLLFGMEYTDGHSVIVVEGHFDRFRLGDGAVATLGTNCTQDQIKLLIKYSIVKIVFDGDKDGRRSAERLGNDLAPFTDVRIYDLADDMDPDKLNPKQIRQIKN